MKQARYVVHSMLIPLRGEPLILPCAAVAEIVPCPGPERVDEAPEWWLGNIPWRGRTIAVVSFESACGSASVSEPPAHVAVMNGQTGHPELAFYAVAIKSIPRLLKVDDKTLTPQDPEASRNPLVLARVLVKGEPALIPDLPALEDKLAAASAELTATA
jgi:chemosensory pili system protein ChpC